MLKILQARLQQYVNCEITDIPAGFRKGRGNKRSNCQHLLDRRKSKRVTDKQLLLLYLLHQSLWLCGSQQTVGNSSRDGNTRPPYLFLEKSLWVRKQQLEPDMEQWTGSKLGKGYVKTVCHPAYLTSMQSTWCEMPGWMNLKLKSRLQGEISTTWYANDTYHS